MTVTNLAGTGHHSCAETAPRFSSHIFIPEQSWGCLQMLASSDVDTSSQLLLSLPSRVKSATLNGATKSTWTWEEVQQDCWKIPLASKPASNSGERTDYRWWNNLTTGQIWSLSNT